MLPIRLEKAKGRDLIKKLDAEVAKTGGKNESSICGVVSSSSGQASASFTHPAGAGHLAWSRMSPGRGVSERDHIPIWAQSTVAVLH